MIQQRCLAELDAGDRARIHTVLFDSLRSKYAPLGLGEGATLECVERQPDHLTVVTSAGTRVRISRDDARFVAVAAA